MSHSPIATESLVSQPVLNTGLTHSVYTEKERMFALGVFAETGNITYTSRVTGIPYSTIQYWVSDDRNIEILDGLRGAIRKACAWDYVAGSVIALQRMHERLERGDPHVTKDGEVIYLPVKAIDACKIAAICTDKHALLTATANHDAKVEQALSLLADGLMAELAKRGVTPQTAEPVTSPPLGLDASPYVG